MRIFPALLAASLLVGCATTQTTTATTALATAQSDVSQAIAFYQTAKGIAQVAALADPKLAAPITAAIAVLDPLMATAQAAMSAANTDAPTLEALAAQIQGQATNLVQTAAPAVKVVGG